MKQELRIRNFDESTLKRRIVLRRIIQGLIILGIFVMALTPINHENDVFWQVRMGEEIVNNHRLPTKDIYSSSAYGETWTLHEWLPSVLFYLINSRFGWAGLIFFKAILVAGIFSLFMLLFNKLKANLYLSLLIFVLAALVNTRGVWVVFPSIFEYLFLVLTIYLLEIYREKKSEFIPFILMILSLVWANSHGSFFLLPAITFIYLTGDFLFEKLKNRLSWYEPIGDRFDRGQRKMLFAVAIVSLLTPLFTPNGYITYLYPFKITFGKFTQYISEYMSFFAVWKEDWSYFVHLSALILMLVLGLIFIFGRKKIHPIDFLLGTFFTILALSAVRHVAIFALVALFILVRYISFWFGEYRGVFARSLFKDILILFVIVCFIYYYKTKIAPLGLSLSEVGYPKDASEFINASGIPGNMFNHYDYGGYLIWKMPKYKVFIDGRLEMYEGQAGEDYLTILLAKKGFEKLFDTYRINFFLINIAAPIVEKLIDNPNWKYVYHDNAYVIFVKNSPQNSEFLARNWSEEKEKRFREAYYSALGLFRAEEFNKRGMREFTKNNFIAALTAFTAAVESNPSSIQARLNLAQAFVASGMPDRARYEYEYVLKNIDPRSEEAKIGLKNINK